MRLLLPADPLAPREPEPAFAREAEAARRCGVEVSLVDFEALTAGDATRATRRVTAVPDEPTVYRGWMMRPPVYRALCGALLDRGVRVLNDADAYEAAHLFPGWYRALEGSTPRSVIRNGAREPSRDELAELLHVFGDDPVVLKDFVKSRKHEWAEACFIPRASDTDAAANVVRRFIELQGEDLEGGLVFRAFVDLVSVGKHPKSGMPLARETRVFFLDGEPVSVAPYWDEIEDRGVDVDLDALRGLARHVKSRFFTFDVAALANGGWTLIEVGDGGVSGLPGRADADALYRTLAERLSKWGTPAPDADGTQRVRSLPTGEEAS